MKSVEQLLQKIDVLENEGKRRKAQSIREELLRAIERSPIADVQFVLETLIKENTAMDGIEAAIRAEPYYQNLHGIAERSLGSDHGFTALAKRKLAGVFYIQGRYREAVAIVEKALPVLEARFGHNSFEVREALHSRNSWYNIFDPAKSRALIEQEWGEHPICEHLKPIEEYLRLHQASMWRQEMETRPHVTIFVRAYLDVDSIRRKIALDSCVKDFEDTGPHSMESKGFSCTVHKHSVAGDYVRNPNTPEIG